MTPHLVNTIGNTALRSCVSHGKFPSEEVAGHNAGMRASGNPAQHRHGGRMLGFRLRMILATRSTSRICQVLKSPFILSFGALFLALPASGFCLEPSPTVTCDFLNSDAVFVGNVISVRTEVGEDGFIDGRFYRVRVERVFRGPRVGVMQVYTSNDNGRFTLDVGKEYLLFA